MMRRLPLLLALLMSAFLVASVAWADALVHVKVRGAGAEGRVTLTALDGGRTFTCETESHECRIDGVPGGRYRVAFRPATGAPSRPTEAMIPPAGTVTLFVSAGDHR